MSSELQGLLDAIRERPDDELPRLALADWCMEQTDPDAQARGEFIHLRCRAARLPPDDPARPPLEAQARLLRERHEARWLGQIAKGCDGWDFDLGLVVVELRSGFHRRMSLAWLAKRPDWFWVVGVKGVLLPLAGVERLASQASGALTSIDLGDCDVGPAGARALADAAGRLDRLSRLSLNYARLGDHGAEALAGTDWPRLTGLSLFAAGVGPAGAQALASSPGLGRLASLDLGHNPLRQEGARAAAACAALAGLRHLSLAGCQIGDRGAWSLVHATALERLRSLDARDNGLSEQGKEALRDRFGARVTV